MEEGEDIFDASVIDTIEVECNGVNFTLDEKFSSSLY